MRSVSVLDLLGTGPDAAKTARYLADLLHCNQRGITAAIESARREGVPICATCDSKAPGYYLAESLEALKDYCRSLARREGEIRKTRRALLNAARTK